MSQAIRCVADLVIVPVRTCDVEAAIPTDAQLEFEMSIKLSSKVFFPQSQQCLLMFLRKLLEILGQRLQWDRAAVQGAPADNQSQ